MLALVDRAGRAGAEDGEPLTVFVLVVADPDRYPTGGGVAHAVHRELPHHFGLAHQSAVLVEVLLGHIQGEVRGEPGAGDGGFHAGTGHPLDADVRSILGGTAQPHTGQKYGAPVAAGHRVLVAQIVAGGAAADAGVDHAGRAVHEVEMVVVLVGAEGVAAAGLAGQVAQIGE